MRIQPPATLVEGIARGSRSSVDMCECVVSDYSCIEQSPEATGYETNDSNTRAHTINTKKCNTYDEQAHATQTPRQNYWVGLRCMGHPCGLATNMGTNRFHAMHSWQHTPQTPSPHTSQTPKLTWWRQLAMCGHHEAGFFCTAHISGAYLGNVGCR